MRPTYYLAADDDPSMWTPEGVRAALTKFKRTADEFTTLFRKMADPARRKEVMEKASPALRQRYEAILAKANNVQNAVIGVRDKFNAAVEWLRSVTGMAPQELGVVPLLIFGAVAALAGVTWVVGNTLVEMKAVDRDADLMLAGKIPAQPLSSSASGGVFGSFGRNIAWPAIIIVALVMLPKFLGDRK